MITVAGISPSLDLTYVLPSLRLGEIQRTSHVVRCAGGKPLNLARAAATLGSTVRVVAILGGPTGAGLARSITTAGIGIDTVDTPAETRTCVSIAASDTGTLTEVYQDAPEVSPEVWARFVAQTASVLDQGSGWLAISGGTPPGVDGSGLAELVDLAQRAGFQVAVDTYGPALTAVVGLRPDLVKINRAEAAGLLGSPADADLLTMAGELHDRTGRLVVLTDGVHGAVLVDGSRRLRSEPLDAVGAFPVGSGDSFLAGLLTVLEDDGDLARALRTGVAAGVANALEPGPANFVYSEFKRLRSEVRLSGAGA